jgi:hypothetical protein
MDRCSRKGLLRNAKPLHKERSRQRFCGFSYIEFFRRAGVRPIEVAAYEHRRK